MKPENIFFNSLLSLPEDLKNKLSIHDFRRIWEIAAKPACQATEIELGNGSVEVTWVTRAGKVGVLLRQDEGFHEIGSVTPDPSNEYYPAHGDMVIWISHPGSGQILNEEISAAVEYLCKKMEGDLDGVNYTAIKLAEDKNSVGPGA